MSPLEEQQEVRSLGINAVVVVAHDDENVLDEDEVHEKSIVSHSGN